MSEFVLKHSISLPEWQVFNFMQSMHGIRVESRRNGDYTISCEYVDLADWERAANPGADIPITITARREGLPMEHDQLVFSSDEVSCMIAKLLSFIVLRVTSDTSDRSITVSTHQDIDVWDVAKSLLETRGVNV